jgi:hypothetical protein
MPLKILRKPLNFEQPVCKAQRIDPLRFFRIEILSRGQVSGKNREKQKGKISMCRRNKEGKIECPD